MINGLYSLAMTAFDEWIKNHAVPLMFDISSMDQMLLLGELYRKESPRLVFRDPAPTQVIEETKSLADLD